MIVGRRDAELRAMVARRLRLIGIDSQWVLYDGVGPTGYRLVARSVTGGRLYNPWTGKLVSTFIPWPPVPAQTLLGVLAAIRALRAARGDRGWR